VKFGTRITRTRFDIETPFLEKTPVVALPVPRLASESQPALTAIFFSALCASALFGSVTVGTLFLKLASRADPERFQHSLISRG